jgi:hypothetical protein
MATNLPDLTALFQGPRFDKLKQVINNPQGAPAIIENSAYDPTSRLSAFPNDVHQDFVDYLIALGDTFRKIDTPSKLNLDFQNQGFSDSIVAALKAYDNVTPVGGLPNKILLPAFSNDFPFTYLFNGANLIPINLNGATNYVAILKYLKSVISVTDLNTILSAENMIEQLYKYDINFKDLVKKLINFMLNYNNGNLFETLKNQIQIPDASSLENVVLSALSDDALYIVNKLKSIDNTGIDTTTILPIAKQAISTYKSIFDRIKFDQINSTSADAINYLYNIPLIELVYPAAIPFGSTGSGSGSGVSLGFTSPSSGSSPTVIVNDTLPNYLVQNNNIIGTGLDSNEITNVRQPIVDLEGVIINLISQNKYYDAFGLIAVVGYMVDYKKVSFGNTEYSSTEFNDYLRNVLIKGDLIVKRLRLPIANTEEDINNLRKIFADGLTRRFGSKIGSAPPSNPTYVPNYATLADPNIKKFYDTIVLPNQAFFDKFIVLLHQKTPVKIDAAQNVPLTSLNEYRLNLKKVNQFEYSAIQSGGAFNDLIFSTLLPDYDQQQMGNINFARNITLSKSVIDTLPDVRDTIRNIFNQTYQSQSPSTSDFVLQFGPQTITVPRSVINRIYTSLPDLAATVDPFASIIVTGSTPTVAPGYEKLNGLLAKLWEQEVFKDWKYDPNTSQFVNTNPNNTSSGDLCNFFDLSNQNTADCIQKLVTCVSSDAASFGSACVDMLDSNLLTINADPSVIVSQVRKMNPLDILKILQRFGFGTIRVPDPWTKPIPNIELDKVVTVTQWLGDLPNVKSIFGDTPAKQDQVIQKIITNRNLLRYLDILSTYINAIPQLLNPEYSGPSAQQNGVPNSNSYYHSKIDYNLYLHRNPYNRIQPMSNNLLRLQSCILSGTAGFNAPSLIANTINTPSNISMPFNPYAWANPPSMNAYSNYGYRYQSGGYPANSNSAMEQLHANIGTDILRAIYSQLKLTMDQATNNNSALGNNTNQRIMQKLATMEHDERDIRGELFNLKKMNDIYIASQGTVNPYNINPVQLPALIEKHKYLFEKTKAYNQRALQFLDIMITLDKVVQEKCNLNKNGSIIHHNLGPGVLNV